MRVCHLQVGAGQEAESAHPALQLRGELGLEPAGCPFTVVPLDEDFVSQGSAAPQLLQVMELMGGTEN